MENRLPGGDVNPYLAIAAMIAAGLHGMDNELPLEDEMAGNAYEADKPHVPTNLRRHGSSSRTARRPRAAFGEEVVEHYLNMARVEIEAFEAAVLTGSATGPSSACEPSHHRRNGGHRERELRLLGRVPAFISPASYVQAVQRPAEGPSCSSPTPRTPRTRMGCSISLGRPDPHRRGGGREPGPLRPGAPPRDGSDPGRARRLRARSGARRRRARHAHPRHLPRDGDP